MSGLQNLGPPLYISMNSNVTPIIHIGALTLKNRVSWKRLLSRLYRSPTASIERNTTEAYVRALIKARQSLKPLKSQSTPFLHLMSYCLSWKMPNFVSCVVFLILNEHAYSNWSLLLVAYAVRGQLRTGGITAYTAWSTGRIDWCCEQGRWHFRLWEYWGGSKGSWY